MPGMCAYANCTERENRYVLTDHVAESRERFCSPLHAALWLVGRVPVYAGVSPDPDADALALRTAGELLLEVDQRRQAVGP
jgi:hypothetical protein